jgi:Cu+-exporting ATPase
MLIICTGRRLAVAWTLAAVCLVGHSHHFLGHFGPSWLHMLHSTGFHAALSVAALAGPGRKLLVDGWKSFWRGSPNMNTLVGLGAVSSFAVSTAAALLPKLVYFLVPSPHSYLRSNTAGSRRLRATLHYGQGP